MRRAVFLFALALVACGGDDTSDLPKVDAGADVLPDTFVAPGDLVGLGRMFVAQRKCPDCHQSKDAKDGVLTGQTIPQPDTQAYPANLTPDPDTGIDAWDDATYARAFREGIDDEGEALCPPMPHFADMKDDEAKAIAAYLRSLPPTHRHVPESTCPPLKPAPPPQDAGTDAAPPPIDAAPMPEAGSDGSAVSDGAPSDADLAEGG